MVDLKVSIRKKQKELAELVSEIKARERFKARTRLEKLALKLARESKKQVIYGSVAARAYARTIRPRDIDIGTPSPYKMARKLKEEALKRGIKAELKKKYIKQIKANIYEVNSVSYSPLQEKKLKESIIKDRLRQTGITTEVKALAGTIARTQAQYRARRDYLKLRRIKLLLSVIVFFFLSLPVKLPFVSLTILFLISSFYLQPFLFPPFLYRTFRCFQYIQEKTLTLFF